MHGQNDYSGRGMEGMVWATWFQRRGESVSVEGIVGLGDIRDFDHYMNWTIYCFIIRIFGICRVPKS